MLKKVEIEAKNLNEAQKKAVQILRVPLEKITFEVIKEKKGILGIGSSATYLASLNLNLGLEGKEYLERIFSGLDIEVKMEMRSKNEGMEIYYTIKSDENALLIGRDGKTLKAIQYLLRNYLSMFSEEFVVVNLDIGNYNENRKKQLEIIATKTAKEVAKTKIEVKLDPMNSYERRIIHAKLAEWRDVTTTSVGEGEHRAIIIKPVK
ncbi:RNA-binding cell elongation regulator Jag/EloR [Haploplasma modicum]|jgi:spoIIIJ-associated protein|uniref:RNA-binding cell elongation regulator Jag/EloR n=1 Tax=Haploplasma modicum TaxID=2150 RepID=UPI00214C6F85|nr:RNA-binding cell elongation regulator Jag/EloR [Haploplasma modicum]MCR1809299.1 KH domain-containing protein [Haploplasma modicum]